MEYCYKKVVVKVGTNVIAKSDGSLDRTVMASLVQEISKLKNEAVDIIFVTSGAVGAGTSVVQIRQKANDVIRRQILASVGQITLMKIYSELFATHHNICSQVLVTKEDFKDRQHYLNLKNCFEALLEHKIVPIVNENDVVSVTELMFTDNDELAGLIASMLNVNALIILTNVDGIFDGSSVLPVIKSGTNLENFISPETSSFGRGGMLTKARLGAKLSKLGITTHIANGKNKQILGKILKGENVGTKFLPEKNLSSIKRWIAYSSGYEKGKVYVNKCAEEALTSQTKAASLLPVGITKIEGDFKKGDIVRIRNEQDKDIGFGLTQYDSSQAREVIGKKNKRPFIHYDYLFLE